MVKGASLHGIFVGSKAQFEAMNAGIEANDLHPLIDKTFPLNQARAAYAHQTSGNFMGKIVITL
jgi:NADPH:quinone reductase-like Zn-dependent oxidoreductase